jgi:hypothetical protein
MKRPIATWVCLLTAVLLAAGLPFGSEAKSYSSGGGRSYSSHSSGSGGSHSFGGSSRSFGAPSRSSNSGGGSSKSFSSGSGKSYSAGSKSSDDNRHGYSASKSYSSGGNRLFKSGSADDSSSTSPARDSAGRNAGFSFDRAAARAKKEEASRSDFKKFKDAQIPKPSAADDNARPGMGASDSYGRTPPRLPASNRSTYGSVYIPDREVLISRPARIRTVFYPYYSRPVVIYHDPYNSLFWWWLLDRSLDDRAWWAYHHRYDMDPARYQTLLATDQQLESRVAQLEAQQVQRDPNYVPQGVSQDLMYSDRYVAHAYSNRPTLAGALAFWVFAVPLAGGFCVFFIWLIWFKRWQTAT